MNNQQLRSVYRSDGKKRQKAVIRVDTTKKRVQDHTKRPQDTVSALLHTEPEGGEPPCLPQKAQDVTVSIQYDRKKRSRNMMQQQNKSSTLEDESFNQTWESIQGSQQDNCLNKVLSIQPKKINLTSIEEEQLISGIEAIVHQLLFPEFPNVQQQEQSQVNYKQHGLEESDSASTLIQSRAFTFEPLKIIQEPWNIAPNNVKERVGGSTPRRSTVDQNYSTQNDTFNLVEVCRKSASINTKTFSTRAQRQKQQVKQHAQLIAHQLSDEMKLKFIKSFNQVPSPRNLTKDVEKVVSDLMRKRKPKHLKAEFVKINNDLIRSKNKLLDSNDHFVSPRSPQSSCSKGLSYLGVMPMQEPPYTLSLMRDRKERLERRKNRLPINPCQKHQVIAKSIKVDKTERDSQTSLPELNLGLLSALGPASPREIKNTRSVLTQQSKSRKMHNRTNPPQVQWSSRQESEEVNKSHARDPSSTQRNIQSPNSTIMQQYAQRLQSSAAGTQTWRNYNQTNVFPAPNDLATQIRLSNALQDREKKSASAIKQNETVKLLSKSLRKYPQQHEQQSNGSQLATKKKNFKIANNNFQSEQSVCTAMQDDPSHPTADHLMQTLRASTMSTGARKSPIEYQDPIDGGDSIEIDLRILEAATSLAKNDQYTKYLQQQDKLSAVKVEQSSAQTYKRSQPHDHSVSRVAPASKSLQNGKSYRFQQLSDYSQELFQSYVAFEKQFEENSLKYESFISFIHERVQLLDSVFKKSFMLGKSAAMLPPAVQELFSGLVDGYQKTLVAFGKFCHRQQQQLQYKIERLTKVNQDLRNDLHDKREHDKFLQQKLENIKMEMERIEANIELFNDTSLHAEKKQKIKDSFSDVTAHLTQIANDLSQDSPENQVPSEDNTKQGVASPNKSRTLRVIPFQTFKKQIDSNYSEVQTKTTRAIIQRLGLGADKSESTDAFVQTEGEYVEKLLYEDTKALLENSKQQVQKLESKLALHDQNETQSLIKLAKKKRSVDRLKESLNGKIAELAESRGRVNELETLTQDFPKQLSQKQARIDELTAQLSQVQKEMVNDYEKKLNALHKKIDTYELRLRSQQEKGSVGGAGDAERLRELEAQSAEKDEKIREQATELIQVLEENERLKSKCGQVRGQGKQIRADLQGSKEEQLVIPQEQASKDPIEMKTLAPLYKSASDTFSRDSNLSTQREPMQPPPMDNRNPNISTSTANGIPGDAIRNSPLMQSSRDIPSQRSTELAPRMNEMLPTAMDEAVEPGDATMTSEVPQRTTLVSVAKPTVAKPSTEATVAKPLTEATTATNDVYDQQQQPLDNSKQQPPQKQSPRQLKNQSPKIQKDTKKRTNSKMKEKPISTTKVSPRQTNSSQTSPKVQNSQNKINTQIPSQSKKSTQKNPRKIPSQAKQNFTDRNPSSHAAKTIEPSKSFVNGHKNVQDSETLSEGSSVSSAELDDLVNEPIDIVSMRKNLRRQTTMCPTKRNLQHTATQTNITGPIQQDRNTQVAMAHGSDLLSDNSMAKSHLNRIHAFSNDRSVENHRNGEDDPIKLFGKTGKLAKGSAFRQGGTDEKKKVDLGLGSLELMINNVAHNVSIHDGEGYNSARGTGRYSQYSKADKKKISPVKKKVQKNKYSEFYLLQSAEVVKQSKPHELTLSEKLMSELSTIRKRKDYGLSTFCVNKFQNF